MYLDYLKKILIIIIILNRSLIWYFLFDTFTRVFIRNRKTIWNRDYNA